MSPPGCRHPSQLRRKPPSHFRWRLPCRALAFGAKGTLHAPGPRWPVGKWMDHARANARQRAKSSFWAPSSPWQRAEAASESASGAGAPKPNRCGFSLKGSRFRRSGFHHLEQRALKTRAPTWQARTSFVFILPGVVRVERGIIRHLNEEMESFGDCSLEAFMYHFISSKPLRTIIRVPARPHGREARRQSCASLDMLRCVLLQSGGNL